MSAPYALLWTGLALAPSQSGGSAEAQRLFTEALSLVDKGDWVGACPKFRMSDAAEPSVGALLNVARCSAREGRLVRAVDELEEVRTRNEKTPDRERKRSVDASVNEALRGLGPRIARVRLVVRPDDAAAQITVDGRRAVVFNAEGDLRLDPGPHEVVVEAPGFRTWTESAKLAEGQRLVLEVELEREARPDAGGPEPRGDALQVAGWASLGAGAVVVGGGIGLLVGLAMKNANEVERLCGEGARPPTCAGSAADAALATDLAEEGRAAEIAGGTLVGVGAAAVAFGAIALVLDATLEDGPVAVRAAPLLEKGGAAAWVDVLF